MDVVSFRTEKEKYLGGVAILCHSALIVLPSSFHACVSQLSYNCSYALTQLVVYKAVGRWLFYVDYDYDYVNHADFPWVMYGSCVVFKTFGDVHFSPITLCLSWFLAEMQYHLTDFSCLSRLLRFLFMSCESVKLRVALDVSVHVKDYVCIVWLGQDSD